MSTAKTLLKLLRDGSENQQSLLSSVETSAALFQCAPRLRELGRVCFVVLNPHTEVRVTHFHFGLHEADARFYTFRGLDSVDDFSLEEIAESAASREIGLVVVLGVVSPRRRLFRRDREMELVEYRNRLLQMHRLASRVREAVAPKAVPVIEAMSDSSEKRVYWDIARTIG